MSNDPKQLRGKPAPVPRPGDVMGIGIQFTATLLAFLFGGRWLDGRLGTGPWLTLGGVLLGFVLSVLWMMYRLGAAGRGPKGGAG